MLTSLNNYYCGTINNNTWCMTSENICFRAYFFDTLFMYYNAYERISRWFRQQFYIHFFFERIKWWMDFWMIFNINRFWKYIRFFTWSSFINFVFGVFNIIIIVITLTTIILTSETNFIEISSFYEESNQKKSWI